MARNKVILKGETLIDLTGDTVTAATLGKGATAHDKSGNQITGTMEVGKSSRFGANYDFLIGKLDENGILKDTDDQVDLVFTGVKTLSKSLEYYFYQHKKLKSISFPDLESITVSRALNRIAYWLSGIESFSAPKLTEIPSNCSNVFDYSFASCKNFTSVDLSALKYVYGNESFYYTFYSCSKLTTVSFNNLIQIGKSVNSGISSNGSHFRSAFSDTLVTELIFPELTTIYCDGYQSYGTFSSNNKITSIQLPKLSVISAAPNNSTANLVAHKNIFYGCSKLTELHFGAANQAAIEASDGYPTLWGLGAGKANVYFDL